MNSAFFASLRLNVRWDFAQPAQILRDIDMHHTFRRQGVAADGSRRILIAGKVAPTAVGGYFSVKCFELQVWCGMRGWTA
jgi:hypothetical protein